MEREEIERFSVYWIDLNPTRESEIQKRCPCIIVSPDELNRYLSTVIIVPLTSTIRNYPFRVHCIVNGQDGEAAVDQLRTVDKSRLGSYISSLKKSEIKEIKNVQQQLFE